MNDITPADANAVMEQVLIKGDLSKLTPQERNSYVRAVCQSLGLNWLTKPFDYINLGGKLVLYAKRDATDQLRKINGVSIEITDKHFQDGLIMVTVKASDKTGRIDSDIGVVPMPKGADEIRSNAIMKAVTKAKRRVTLSICGLGFMDESEIESTGGTPLSDADEPTSYVIPVASRDRAGWITFGHALVRAIKEDGDAVPWMSANQATLKEIEATEPDVHTRLLNRLKELANGQANQQN
jgi:hypothetical protein